MDIERFISRRKSLGYTQKTFASCLGIPNTTADIERGKTKLSGKVVVELIKQFQLNPLWIYGESQVQFIKNVVVSTIPKVVTIDAAGNDNMVLVNAKAAAGYPQNISDSSWYKQLPAFDLPIPEFRNATYRGFQVEGDSMLPNLKPNEWVLARAVESLDHVNHNKIYVVVLYDSVMVKKIYRQSGAKNLSLISINESYNPYEISTDQIQEIWQVSSKISFGVEEPADNGLLRQLQASMEDLKKQLHMASLTGNKGVA